MDHEIALSQSSTVLTPDQRRREQNRAAQRAFRSRREDRMRELEVEIERLKHDVSTRTNSSERVRKLTDEIARLQHALREKDGRIACLLHENEAATQFARAVAASSGRMSSASMAYSPSSIVGTFEH